MSDTPNTHPGPDFEQVPPPEDHNEGTHTKAESWDNEGFAREARSLFCTLKREAEEAVMTLLPPEVTRNLAEAHKEFIRAGQRLGDLAIEELEKKAQRAEKLNERKP